MPILVTSFNSKKNYHLFGVFKTLPISNDFFKWLGQQAAGVKSGLRAPKVAVPRVWAQKSRGRLVVVYK